MTYHVLVVDDEKVLADNIRKYLERSGFTVDAAYAGNAGLDAFKATRPRVIVLDLQLGDSDGIELIRQIRAIDESVKIVLMTAFGSIDVAVRAMKAGANEFLTKPIVLKDLRYLLEDMLGGAPQTAAKADESDYLDRIIGDSPAVRNLKQQVRALLNSESHAKDDFAPPPVLITGQTGTGKELLAQALHYGGKRRKGPFIEINCTTLPETLVESELFGYEKGAFTGAPTRKTGLFEAADGGTLFLDEIGDMPLATQTKLLKAIEDKEIRPVGATRGRKVDVRIIAATNKPLEDLIGHNHFRSDLYFRLCTIRLELPPLAERADDVILLAEHFLAIQARCYQKPTPTLSAQAEQGLRHHHWPGNVRELRNVIEQAVLMSSGGTIEADQLKFSSLSRRSPSPATVESEDSLNLPETEKQLLQRALEQTAWNVSAAAKLLGISRDTLRYRIKRFGISQH